MHLEPLEVKNDRRGSLVEAFKTPDSGQVFYSLTLPGETRGNHYHNRKTEKFLVAWGSALITVKNRDTGDTLKAEVSGNKPMVVTIVPNHTHSITATDEGCLLIVLVNEVFDEEDPDTHPEEI